MLEAMEHRRTLAAAAGILAAVTSLSVVVARTGGSPSPTAGRTSETVVTIVHAAPQSVARAADAVGTLQAALAPTPYIDTPWDKRFPKSPAAYQLTGITSASCDATAIPHFSGFAELGGSGSETVTRPDGSSATYVPAQRHVSLQTVCTNPTVDGNLELDVIVEHVQGDSTIYHLTVGPSGFTVLDVTPGKLGATVPVHQRLGAWPGGCDHLTANGSASIDDTLCWNAAGQLTHIEAHERSTDTAGVHRVLDDSLDLLPNG